MGPNHGSYSFHIIKGLPREVYSRLHQHGFIVTMLWAVDHIPRIRQPSPSAPLSAE